MPSPFRLTVLAPVFFAVAGSAEAQQPLPRTPAEIIRVAERAVATQRAAAVRQNWVTHLRRNPSDRLARLGVATFARLAYDYAAADSFTAPLVARAGTRPDGIAAWARIESALALAQQWRLAETDSLLALAARESAAGADGSSVGFGRSH